MLDLTAPPRSAKRFRVIQHLNHCVKSVQIRSFFWSVFIPNAGKYGPEKTPYLDTFHVVNDYTVIFFIFLRRFSCFTLCHTTIEKVKSAKQYL